MSQTIGLWNYPYSLFLTAVVVGGSEFCLTLSQEARLMRLDFLLRWKSSSSEDGVDCELSVELLLVL